MSIETFQDKFQAARALVAAIPDTLTEPAQVVDAMEWADALRTVCDMLTSACKDYTRDRMVSAGRPGAYYGWRPQEVWKAPHVDVIMSACKAHLIPVSEVLKVDTAKIKKHGELARLCEVSFRKTYGLIEVEQAEKTEPVTMADVPY
jgi:hypothetical protein